MADVTWFKVLTDIFSDDKIKIIQSMPEGDALLVMWFKVLSQAGKTNDGGYIYLRKNIPYTPAMLATLFNKSQMIVELALKLFVEFEMIDIDDNGYLFVTNWERHQSIDALEKIKEQTKIRVQNHREKKKQELLESSVTVTLPKRTSNATELELDLELEKEKDKNSSSSLDPFRLFETEGFGTASSFIIEDINDMVKTYTEVWVCEAMKTAVIQGKRKLSYVRGTLVNWKADGIDKPWERISDNGAKHEGVSQNVRYVSNTRKNKPDEEQSRVYPGRWDTPLSEVSG